MQLSLKECSILELLFDNTNIYFTSARIFEAIWPSEADASEEAVRVHIKSLRRKLSSIGCDDLIKTTIGAGYIIEDSDTEG